MRFTVTPGARRNEVIRTAEGQLRLRIAAPATEGKANRALVAFLARCLDIPRSSVTVVSGSSSRHKAVEIDGLTVEESMRRLEKASGLD